jgi:hypothetical protein
MEVESSNHAEETEVDEEEDGEDGEDDNADIIYPGPYGRRRRRRVPPVKSMFEIDRAHQESYMSVRSEINNIVRNDILRIYS